MTNTTWKGWRRRFRKKCLFVVLQSVFNYDKLTVSNCKCTSCTLHPCNQHTSSTTTCSGIDPGSLVSSPQYQSTSQPVSSGVKRPPEESSHWPEGDAPSFQYRWVVEEVFVHFMDPNRTWHDISILLNVLLSYIVPKKIFLFFEGRLLCDFAQCFRNIPESNASSSSLWQIEQTQEKVFLLDENPYLIIQNLCNSLRYVRDVRIRGLPFCLLLDGLWATISQPKRRQFSWSKHHSFRKWCLTKKMWLFPLSVVVLAPRKFAVTCKEYGK